MSTEAGRINEDVKFILYALDRAARRLEAEVEELGLDYSAEIPATDAELIRKAIDLIQGTT